MNDSTRAGPSSAPAEPELPTRRGEQRHSRLELALDAVGIGVWEYDHRADRIAWNPALCAMLGYVREPVPLGLSDWLRLIHPEDLPGLQARIAQALASDSPLYESEYRLRTADGRWLWLHALGRVAQRDGAGQPLLTVGTLTDISGRKHAELLLRTQHDFSGLLASGPDRETLLQAILDSALRLPELDGGGLYWREPDASYRLVAQRGLSERFFAQVGRLEAGSPQAEIVRQGSLQCSCTPAQEHCTDPALVLEPALAEEGVRSLVVLPIHVDGEPLACLNLASKQTGAVGRLTVEALETLARQFAQALGHALARAAADDRLREREEVYRAIFDQASDGIELVDAETLRLVEVNDAACRLLGYDREELLELTLRDIQADGGDAQVLERAARVRKEGHGRFELRYRRKDGAVVDVQVEVQAVRLRGRDYFVAVWRDIGMEMASRTALANEAEWRRALIEHSRDGVAIFDQDHRIVEANPRFAEMLGYAPEETLGLHSWDLDADLKEPDVRAAFADPLSINATFETRHRRKDGTLYDAEVSVRGARIGGRNVFVTVTRDVSEKKRAREALREREELYRTIVNEAGEAIDLVDAETLRFVEVGQAACRLLGYEHDELVGMPLAAIQADLSQADVETLCARLLETGGGSFEARHRCKDGSVLDTQVSIRVMRLRGRDYFLGIWRDVTERRRIERALQETMQFLRDGQSIAGLGGWKANPDTGLLVWTEEVYRLVDRVPDRALLTLDDGIGYFAPECRPLLRERLREAWDSGTPFTLECEMVAGSGRRFWGELRCVGRASDAGGPYLTGTLQDISERKRVESELQRAREEAEAANAAKSEFLALMSHEIRTPMNVVLGLAQILERGPLAPDQLDMVERIRTAGSSLLAILNDLLDFSKIEAQQLQIAPRPFDLRALLGKLARLMGEAARAKGLSLRIESQTVPAGLLLGDALRLEQVLVNLVGNAVKFTERGEVGLSVAASEAAPPGALRVRFTVEDSGIGIAPQTLARLFVPFTQADAGTARRFGGTGLGLSICKRLVELMGGQIGVESQVGRGSVFRFELVFPRAAADEREPAAGLPGWAGPRLAGARLLVVDDSAANRDLVERALALEGARATLAADGQEAVDLLRSSPDAFDAVLMDIRMPRVDGLAATRLIRRELGLGRLPVIALTAGVLEEERSAAQKAGVDAFLAKPVDVDELTTTLGYWIGPRPLARDPSIACVRCSPPPSDRDASGGLPAIPGIDPSRVGPLLHRDQPLFLRLLARFGEELGDAVAQTRRALADGDREGAARRLHTLRGDAANLGATELAGLAAELEECLARGSSGADLEGRIGRLDGRILAFLDGSAPWRMPAPSPAPAHAGAGPAPDPARLRALCEALRNNNTKAGRLFAELEPSLGAAMGAERTKSLGESIRNLSFEPALAVLELAALEATPGPPDRAATDVP